MAKKLLLIYRAQGLHSCSQERTVTQPGRAAADGGWEGVGCAYLLEKEMCEGEQ